jgi:two-component system phosphate regulon sensor histidine kinase PhoR
MTTYARMINLISSKAEIKKRIGELSGISDARITLIDAKGMVLADSDRDVSKMDNHLNRPEIQEARVKGEGRATRFSRTPGVDMFYIALPVKDGSEINGYIRLARPLFEIRNAAREFCGLILQLFGIILVFSFVIAFIFFSRLISPIEEMEQFTKRLLRKGDDPETLIINSSDEMGRLAGNINYIIMELQYRVRYADEEKGKVEAAFAGMSDGVMVLNSQDKIETLNKTFEDISGIKYSDIIGKMPIKETKIPVSQEIALGDEDRITLDVNISSIQGLPGGAMILFHDVTRLKKLEKMRADFVANVTNEIKTPLTAILGFIKTLQEGTIEERETAGKFLKTIYRHAARLKRLRSQIEKDLSKTQYIPTSRMQVCGYRGHLLTLTLSPTSCPLLP